MSKPTIYQEPGRKEEVRAMFNSIAGRYDFLNHFLSLGIDRIWRRRLIAKLAADNPDNILDLATGTADLAIAAAKATKGHITGTDISEEMLEVGREKVRQLGLEKRIHLEKADSESLLFPDDHFDAAMVAYGVRNYENLPKGLAEMHRVLKPGAQALILEFSKPKTFPVKQLFFFYFRFILPLIGRLVSKHSSAYTYLPESVQAFPQGKEFALLMQQVGFTDITVKPLTFGITTLYSGRK